MSFLKNIMRPFVEFNEKGEEAPNELPKAGPNENDYTRQPVAPAVPDHQTFPAAPVYTSASTTPSTPVALVEYQKHFEDLIEEANSTNPLFQGTDFKEFIDSKADVQSITDETTRYQTAFNILKRAGLTKEKLVRTGQEYVKLIEGDLKGFEGAYSQKYRTDVEQREQSLKAKEEELRALEKKIAGLKDDVQRLSQEIVKSKEQLTANKDAFFLAGENKKREIQLELQKIQQHFS